MKMAAALLTGAYGATEILDEASAAYVTTAQPCFEKLQDGASRLAGLLVLAAFNRSRHVLDHGARDAATSLIGSAVDQYAALQHTERTRHFHHHLGRAAMLLRQTLRDVELTMVGSSMARDPLPALQRGWEELKHASRSLPGFEVVDFSHSCCALHRPTSN